MRFSSKFMPLLLANCGAGVCLSCTRCSHDEMRTGFMLAHSAFHVSEAAFGLPLRFLLSLTRCSCVQSEKADVGFRRLVSAPVGESVYDFHACSFSFTSLCCACNLPELYLAACPDSCTSCGNEELNYGDVLGGL
jgi:hypothetical protein